MIAQSKRSNYETLYQYLTTTVDGIISPIEIATKEDLDKRIEKMLNEDGYSKGDFIVIQAIDYTIDAVGYSDETATTEETATNGKE